MAYYYEYGNELLGSLISQFLNHQSNYQLFEENLHKCTTSQYSYHFFWVGALENKTTQVQFCIYINCHTPLNVPAAKM